MMRGIPSPPNGCVCVCLTCIVGKVIDFRPTSRGHKIRSEHSDKAFHLLGRDDVCSFFLWSSLVTFWDISESVTMGFTCSFWEFWTSEIWLLELLFPNKYLVVEGTKWFYSRRHLLCKQMMVVLFGAIAIAF